MIQADYIHRLPRLLKALVFTFVTVLSIGYFSALLLVEDTTQLASQGIIENYNGNEDNELAEEMKFKKSKHEMLNILHTHMLSMSIMFFLLGILFYGVKMNGKVKSILMIEPIVSILITFGGIYLIWKGVEWMSLVVMISGGLMTLSFAIMVLSILYALFRPIEQLDS